MFVLYCSTVKYLRFIWKKKSLLEIGKGRKGFSKCLRNYFNLNKENFLGEGGIQKSPNIVNVECNSPLCKKNTNTFNIGLI